MRVGGPGSNKSSLCQKVLRTNTGWGHVSMGPLLRSLATSQQSLQEAISSGKIVDEVNLSISQQRVVITNLT